ncbi:MAG: hypothetical protein A2252_12285 [Elusimicrobia bacterium RIFOXYA2_FULL_39_19]|nr:MAG: hypothetical protein A2252_12285 [Elusimicrobia bacterium RIFOXYA2_FULL_39_19]
MQFSKKHNLKTIAGVNVTHAFIHLAKRDGILLPFKEKVSSFIPKFAIKISMKNPTTLPLFSA